MELRRTLRALILGVIFLECHVFATSMTLEVGNLGIAAQACLATAFWECSCVMLDFQCGCKCAKFSPDVNSCIADSCSSAQQKQALGLFSSTCATATAITTSSATKSTSSATSSSKSSISASQSMTTTRSTGTINTITSSQTGTESKGSDTSTFGIGGNTKTGGLSSSSAATSVDGGVFHGGASSTISFSSTKTPSPTIWGSYGGNNTTAGGTATACWLVTASGNARSTCAIQADPFQGLAGRMEPIGVLALALLVWGSVLMII